MGRVVHKRVDTSHAVTSRCRNSGVDGLGLIKRKISLFNLETLSFQTSNALACYVACPMIRSKQNHFFSLLTSQTVRGLQSWLQPRKGLCRHAAEAPTTGLNHPAEAPFTVSSNSPHTIKTYHFGLAYAKSFNPVLQDFNGLKLLVMSLYAHAYMYCILCVWWAQREADAVTWENHSVLSTE